MPVTTSQHRSPHRPRHAGSAEGLSWMTAVLLLIGLAGPGWVLRGQVADLAAPHPAPHSVPDQPA